MPSYFLSAEREEDFVAVFEVVFEEMFLGVLGWRSTLKLAGILLVEASTATVKLAGLQEAIRGTFLRRSGKEVVGGSEE